MSFQGCSLEGAASYALAPVPASCAPHALHGMRTQKGFIMMQAEAMLTEGGGSTEQLRTAWKHIGDTCAWRGQWKQV